MCVFAFYIKIIITFYKKKINLSIWQIFICNFVSFTQSALLSLWAKVCVGSHLFCIVKLSQNSSIF